MFLYVCMCIHVNTMSIYMHSIYEGKWNSFTNIDSQALTHNKRAAGLKQLLFWPEVEFLGEHRGKARHLFLPNGVAVIRVPNASHWHFPVYECE